MDKQLPVFELTIDDQETGVNYIALVDKPAIERGWMAFNEHKPQPMAFAIQDEVERVVFGPAMIPNMQIYRNDENGEYFVTFTADTIKKIAYKFFESGFQNNANEMHDPNQRLQGVTFFQSVIKDSSKGIVGMDGDYPDGTWFVGAKLMNEEAWAKAIAGQFTGFSVEGMFKYKRSDEQLLAAIKNLLVSK